MKRLLSAVIEQFFSDILIKKYPDYIEMIKILLDFLQQENFKDDGYSPYSLITELNNLIDIDKLPDNLKSHFIDFLPFSKELNEKINSKMGWREFIKIAKYIYKKKGTFDYFNIFKFFYGNVDLVEMDISNPDHQLLFDKILLNKDEIFPNPMNNIYSYYDTTIVPMTYVVENLDNLKINITEFGTILKYIKPVGVLLVLLNIYLSHEFYLEIEIDEYNIGTLIESIMYINNRNFDIQFKETDTTEYYIEEDILRYTITQPYQSNPKNIYLSNDFTFEEIGNIIIEDTLRKTNGYDDLYYGYCGFVKTMTQSQYIAYIESLGGDTYSIFDFGGGEDSIIDGSTSSSTPILSGDDSDVIYDGDF